MKTLRFVSPGLIGLRPGQLVAVLVVILTALLAASPALAKPIAGGASSTTYKLAPPANAPERGASGQWTLYTDPLNVTESVALSCRNLTPGRQYTIVVLVHWSQWARIGSGPPYQVDSGDYSLELAVTADAKGRLSGQCSVVGTWSPTGGVNRSVQDLWIENEDGNVVLE